jgi:DNA ligase 4
VLHDSIGLNKVKCKIKKQCIVDGELLVYNNADKRIKPSYKIPWHVKQLEHFLGTTIDSPINLRKHLMIMFYNIPLLNDIVCIRKSHDKQHELLESRVCCILGQADIGTVK